MFHKLRTHQHDTSAGQRVPNRNRTHDPVHAGPRVPNTRPVLVRSWIRFMGLGSRTPARCRGGHGFDSCKELRFFFVPRSCHFDSVHFSRLLHHSAYSLSFLVNQRPGTNTSMFCPELFKMSDVCARSLPFLINGWCITPKYHFSKNL